MGMYTELIFGARLKKDTPEVIINTIKYLIGEEISHENIDHNLPENISCLIGCSYYFGVTNAVNKFYKDNDRWVLSSRSNHKNYNNEFESFLDWIKPHIDFGSGKRDIYAFLIYEADLEPKIYYLDKEEE